MSLLAPVPQVVDGTVSKTGHCGFESRREHSIFEGRGDMVRISNRKGFCPEEEPVRDWQPAQDERFFVAHNVFGNDILFATFSRMHTAATGEPPKGGTG